MVYSVNEGNDRNRKGIMLDGETIKNMQKTYNSKKKKKNRKL